MENDDSSAIRNRAVLQKYKSNQTHMPQKGFGYIKPVSKNQTEPAGNFYRPGGARKMKWKKATKRGNVGARRRGPDDGADRP
ncbi:MAG: hypothetical protein V3S64_07370 [bacterium]